VYIVNGSTTPPIWGYITQLNALILASPDRTAANLGFHAQRLDAGFKILVLKRLPQTSQFQFDGTTMRSGGRDGLPAASQKDDAKRGRVHDSIKKERGISGYADLQKAVLRDMKTTGPKRLVKVIPNTAHDQNMGPDKQYPMGGGFLQWTLVWPGIPFFCAAEVGPGDVAKIPARGKIPKRVLNLNTGNFLADYPQRAALQTYLQSV
jgi:hypothetical protein